MCKRLFWLSLIALLLTACGDTDNGAPAVPATTSAEQSDVIRYPTILDATLSQNSDGTWSVAVTLSSTYDTPERYADGWRVLDEQGNTIGDRPLAHDHQAEQPFTRSTNGVVIPEGAATVTIEARDQHYGWSPDTLVVEVPSS